ncbi:Uncharacterised protein [Halioglobus japonicus]|nr:Uncharacterised protein [Halioglobus japonicus]
MSKPQPIITALAQPYWDAIAQGSLALQRCVTCRRWIHFPEPRCPGCGGHELGFEPVSGDGVVESFSIIHRSFVEGYGSEPYAIAWVALPEQAGLRTMSNIVDCNIEDIAIGAAVTLCFEQRGDFGDIPQFTLTSNNQED